jgi:putative IMPACT (imprinted ancient) family translation regulator
MFNFKLSFSSDMDTLYNDFELMKSIYSDSIEVIEDDMASERLIFKITIKEEYDIDDSMAALVKELKFDELFVDCNHIGLPWRVTFTYAKGDIFIECFIFWLKKQPDYFNNFNLNDNFYQESIFFSMMDLFRQNLPIPDKNVILNWLQEMKEKAVITHLDIYSLYDKSNISLNKEHDLLEQFENNLTDKDCDEEEAGLDVLKSRSAKILEKNLKKQQQKTETVKDNENTKTELYTKFFDEGGVVGEIISDRGSTFQAHGIRITNQDDVKKYLDYLRSNNKIFKATHNIYAYRISDTGSNNNKNGVTEGFDDDGEDGAGIRLLGILQKLKVVNTFIVVSRWFGGTLLGNDRYKHINDTAKNLILKNKSKFDFND